jgi:HTH-type transcriptional repressor of NAD biosynthesis genes
MEKKQLRIVVIGAESTGKTTLSQRLAKFFESDWVAEYAREHWDRKIAVQPVESNPHWTGEELRHIAVEQKKREAEKAENGPAILFCDTNAFSTGTWFERYFGRRDPQIDALGTHDNVDLYLFCRSDAPFVQDGVRDGEKIRDWMDRRFETQLRLSGVPVIDLRGNFELRWQTAITAIEKFRPGLSSAAV